MRCLIINHETRYLDELHVLFSDFSPVVIRHDEFKSKNAEGCDFVVLSGGPINISGENDILEIKEFLRRTKIPVFGICLGLEIFGVTFGKPLLELSERRYGVRPFSLRDISGNLFYNQKWYINEVPDGFFILAQDDSVITAMAHTSLPFFGIQGHPEVSGEFGASIRDYFIKHYVALSGDNK